MTEYLAALTGVVPYSPISPTARWVSSLRDSGALRSNLARKLTKSRHLPPWAGRVTYPILLRWRFCGGVP